MLFVREMFLHEFVHGRVCNVKISQPRISTLGGAGLCIGSNTIKSRMLPYAIPVKDTGHTIGNCQRPVFTLGLSQHMHKITNL